MMVKIYILQSIQLVMPSRLKTTEAERLIKEAIEIAEAEARWLRRGRGYAARRQIEEAEKSVRAFIDQVDFSSKTPEEIFEENVVIV